MVKKYDSATLHNLTNNLFVCSVSTIRPIKEYVFICSLPQQLSIRTPEADL